jgi:CO/xanthine dehydrogenase FAD-binding subunit
MQVALPRTLDEAVSAAAAEPDAELLAGGTDFCVEVNFGLRRPPRVVCLRRVAELRRWQVDDQQVVLGAGTTYTDMVERLAHDLPGLAAAARTVGSPQIRNAGTLGGNIGTASPAGDALPFLVAADAAAGLWGPDGGREVPVADLITGVKKTDIQPGEVVVEVRMPRIRGPQQFLKVGTRNAMVIAIASAALIVDVDRHQVRCALGSVGPVPVRTRAAEQLINAEMDWAALTAPASAVDAFAAAAAEAASPITDHRSTAAYRRRAVEVICARGLRRCLSRVD